MKKILFSIILLGMLSSQSSYALGYVSRDCPGVGSKESFTMSWFDSEWLYTYSVLFKKVGSSGVSYDWRKSGTSWEYKMRSAAGIFFGYGGDMSDYWAGVYGIHYWYNLDNQQVESRRRYVSQNCDLLNWGVNNW